MRSGELPQLRLAFPSVCQALSIFEFVRFELTSTALYCLSKDPVRCCRGVVTSVVYDRTREWRIHTIRGSWKLELSIACPALFVLQPRKS